jgi:3-dehydroquinate dehydratase/shikimate dehydrogenase
MTLALSSVAPRFLPQRLPRVCLALSGDTIEDMLATGESMARDNPFVEFRLDYLKQPLAALPKIHRFLETHQYITAIGTCRRADNGGKFKGSLAAQLEVLSKASAAGCQMVDVELQSAL